jgi:hypothetical protein
LQLPPHRRVLPKRRAAGEATKFGRSGVKLLGVVGAARGGAPEGERNGNYRHGARTKPTIELWRFIKSLR